jgi:hypothetical protein
VEDSAVNEAGGRPFNRLALVVGVGVAGLMLAWTIMRTISEVFGWPYYGWPFASP